MRGTLYRELSSLLASGLPLAQALEILEPAGTNYTVLITHAGVEGQMPNMPGGLTFDQLAPLQPHVKYLALGHLHKPYSVDEWIFNPGSLETCSFDEMQYARGCYIVEVDADGQHVAMHEQNLQRLQRFWPIGDIRLINHWAETGSVCFFRQARCQGTPFPAAPG